MADWMSAALDKVCPEINGLIDDFNAGVNTRIKKEALLEDIMKMLSGANLAYVTRKANASVWVDMCNRFGAGLDTKDVNDLLYKIVTEKGWSTLACVKARAFEREPGETEQYQFNLKLVEASDGYLAPVDPHEPNIILSFSCSHTVAGLRALAAGCKSNHEQLAVDGLLNKEKVLDMSPSMRAPMDDGMEWTVIRAPVRKRCPHLATFAQFAGNADHGTAREMTKTQLLLQMHGKARMFSTMHTGNWKASVAADMERQHAALQGGAIDLAEFVENWSGGQSGANLVALDNFSKCLPSRRDIKPRDFAQLGRVRLAQGEEWIIACVKAMLSSPAEYEHCGVSKLICKEDIDSMTGGQKTAVMAAVGMIRAARAWVSSCTSAAVAKAVDDFEVRLVMHVHRKRAKSRLSFKTVDEIGARFTDDVRTATGTPPTQPSPFRPTTAESSDTAPAAFRVLTADALIGRGFDVGAKIVREKVEYTITEVTDAKVAIVTADDTIVLIEPAKLLDEFTRVKVEAVWRFNPQVFQLESNYEAMRDEHKTVLKIALRACYESWKYGVDVEVQMKPKRSVFTRKAYRANELVLVPFTTNVYLADSANGPTNCCSFGVMSKHPVSGRNISGYAVAKNELPTDPYVEQRARPKVSQPMVAPIWLVSTTADSVSANMHPFCSEVEIVTKAGGVEQRRTVGVPCIRNTRALKLGDELILAEAAKKCIEVKMPEGTHG
jgi:hypothetical protein